jgi:hypothetical protein
MLAQGKQPEVLFWVGCAGSFDDRAKKITKAFVRILKLKSECAVWLFLVLKKVALVILQKSRETSSCFKCRQ